MPSYATPHASSQSGHGYALGGLASSAGFGASVLCGNDDGESYPVASNDDAANRQLNRRVEIVLSDESGRVNPR